MSTDTLVEHFNQLSPHDQSKLIRFMEHLLHKSEPTPQQETGFRMNEVYRHALNDVSVWTDDDLAAYEASRAGWSFEPRTWS